MRALAPEARFSFSEGYGLSPYIQETKRWANVAVRGAEDKQQVPPLRYATVGMTHFLQRKCQKTARGMNINSPKRIVIPTEA
jgi:hypothetical protein